MPEIWLDEAQLRRVREEARGELPVDVVARLDEAFQVRSGDDVLEATERYFRGFSGRLQTHIRKVASDRVHHELPSVVARWFERSLPGTIPGGATSYFQLFAEHVWARIRSVSAPETIPHWLDEALAEASQRSTVNDTAFFETFVDRVNRRVSTGEVVADWLDRLLFEKNWSMPVDEREYFHRFAGRVAARIEGHEEAVPDWLEERLSTAEFAVATNVGQSKIAGRIEADRPARRKGNVRRLHQPVVQWAVAAAICLLLAVGVLINAQVSTDILVAPRSIDEAWLLQQSLSGSSAFVENFPFDAASEISLENVGGHAMGQVLQDATPDELSFIIENLQTD